MENEEKIKRGNEYDEERGERREMCTMMLLRNHLGGTSNIKLKE